MDMKIYKGRGGRGETERVDSREEEGGNDEGRRFRKKKEVRVIKSPVSNLHSHIVLLHCFVLLASPTIFFASSSWIPSPPPLCFLDFSSSHPANLNPLPRFF